MIKKISKNEAKNEFKIYPEVYLRITEDYITAGSYIPITRDNKVFLGYIRKEFERPSLLFEHVKVFMKDFDKDVSRMQKKGIVINNDYSLFYEIEDAKDTRDI